MAKLWEPNEKYKASMPQWWDNMPYKRLYRNLTWKELTKLLQDAKSLNWEILDLRCCGLDVLPDALGELEDLRDLALSNYSNSTKGNHNTFRQLPDSITRLKNLQSLDLRWSQIRALPNSIGNLISLQWLNLYWSKISALPDSIGNLTNLQSLDLSYTQIGVLPDSIGNLTNLQSLDLSYTQIGTLPDSIGNLTNLQWLDLHKGKIGALPVSALPDSIGNLKKLRKLDLCGLHLKAIPYGVVALGLPFVIDDKSPYKDCVNLTGVKLDEGDLQLFAQPREKIEAYYREKGRAVLPPSPVPVPKPTPPPAPLVPKPTPQPEPKPTPELPRPAPPVTQPTPKPEPTPQPAPPVAQPTPKPEPFPQPAPVPEPEPQPEPTPAPLVPKPESPTQDERTQQNFTHLSAQIEELRRQLSESERRNAYRTAIKIAVGVGAALALLLARRLNWFDWLIELLDLLT